MDARIKALWIDALESGEYEQGTGRLRITNQLTGEYSYCCLGVLCDLYSKETGERWGEGGTMHESNTLPPFEVADWAGLSRDERAGDFGDRDVVTMNDGGRTFEEIAQVIRDNA